MRRREPAAEPWVLEGLRYLITRFRAAASESLNPAWLLVERYRARGKYFSQRWMDATLIGHSQPPRRRPPVRFSKTSAPEYPKAARITSLGRRRLRATRAHVERSEKIRDSSPRTVDRNRTAKGTLDFRDTNIDEMLLSAARIELLDRHSVMIDSIEMSFPLWRAGARRRALRSGGTRDRRDPRADRGGGQKRELAQLP